MPAPLSCSIMIVMLLIASTVMAAGYDILLAVAPIILLWDVKIDIHKKMLLCGLLALGFL